jgi:DNA-binding MarR family transcriptional regulator
MDVSTASLSDDSSQAELAKITTYQSGMVQAASHRAIKKFTDDCLAKHNLSTTQWFIIGAVLDASPRGLRVTDIANQVGTTLSFLTNSINLLESKGMLSRADHETDSRAHMVTVNPAFLPQCQIIEDDLRQQLRRTIYAKVSPADLRTYLRVLYKFKDQFETS